MEAGSHGAVPYKWTGRVACELVAVIATCTTLGF